MRPDTILAMATKQVATRSGRKAAKNVRTPARPAHDSIAGRGAKRGGAGARAGTKRGKPGASATAKNSKKDAGLELQPARIEEVLRRLEKAYPNAECALHHRNAWELLVATILSAQCTDARVNMVTPELFRRYSTPAAMAKASLPEIEDLIRTTGFFHNKAKSIQGAAKKITEEFGGQVPETLAELITVPGAARKTANVVLGVAFEKAEG